MQTQSDFFLARYGNPWLAGCVCIVGIVCFVPYLQLQITGVGIIVSVASFGGIGRGPRWRWRWCCWWRSCAQAACGPSPG